MVFHSTYEFRQNKVSDLFVSFRLFVTYNLSDYLESVIQDRIDIQQGNCSLTDVNTEMHCNSQAFLQMHIRNEEKC